MPFILPYDNDEIPELFTTAWAQSSGWMWQIPILNRKGCGYVFDDNFITAEQARAEIETTLGHAIEPIRVLKFDTGRQEKVWINNCLSVGLAAAFAEPLEATSIHTTIVQLLTFIFEFLQPTLSDTLNQGSINSYNRRIADLYDITKEFLVAHYMGGRTDSEFWEYISSGATRTDLVSDILETCKSRMPTNRDLTIAFGTPDMSLWIYVLGGIGAISPDLAKKYIADDGVKILGINGVQESVQKFEYAMNNMFVNQMKYADFIKFLRYKNKE
jgi:tryptophan halogenase